MPSPSKPSHKRARVEDAGAAAPVSRTELTRLLKPFSRDEVLKLLLDSAERDQEVTTAIRSAAEERKLEESMRVQDFSHYFRSISKRLHNTPYRRQFEVGCQLVTEIQEVFEKIVEETPAHASTGTKMSALETMLKIVEDIIDAPTDTGRTVRRGYVRMDCLVTVAETFGHIDKQKAQERGLYASLVSFQEREGRQCEKWDVSEVIRLVSRSSVCTADNSWPVCNGSKRFVDRAHAD